MLYQYLSPEERKGEHKYKAGDWVLYDDRPTEEQQQRLLEDAKKYGSSLKQCAFCQRWIHAGSRKKYCSQRCINDAYMMRRRQRHEQKLHKVCVVCGKQFAAKRVDAKYCSNTCKQSAYRQRSVTKNRSAEF